MKNALEKKVVNNNNVVGMFEAVALSNCKNNKKTLKDKYIVRNLIERGLIMLYGGTGTGKTMLTEWLCYQLTRGDIRQPSRQYYFLGRLCYPCYVYYYTLETESDILNDRSRRYPGNTSKKFKIVDCSGTRPTDLQILQDMKEKAHDHVSSGKKEHLVFVVDPLSNIQFTSVESINSVEMVNFMTQLMNFTHDLRYGRPTVLMLHHVNRAGSFLGSTTIGNVVNGMIEISRISGDRINFQFHKMRATALPPDMILQRNEDLTYTLVDSMNLEDVENLQDRKNLVKIINAAYNYLLIDRASEVEAAKDEDRDPNNITTATITTKSGELPNTIDTLFECKINDILPNEFYKFLDKYRQNLADNGVTFELVTPPGEDDKIRITYTDNTSSTSLPAKPVAVEEVPEKELSPKNNKKTKKKKTTTKNKTTKKNTSWEVPVSDEFEGQLSLLVTPPAEEKKEEKRKNIVDDDDDWFDNNTYIDEPPPDDEELTLEEMYEYAGSSEEDMLKAYEEYCKQFGEPVDWYDDDNIPNEERERLARREAEQAKQAIQDQKELEDLDELSDDDQPD